MFLFMSEKTGAFFNRLIFKKRHLFLLEKALVFIMLYECVDFDLCLDLVKADLAASQP